MLRFTTIAILAGLAAAAPASAAPPLLAAGAADAGDHVRLSDERTLTRLAEPTRHSLIWAKPSPRSRQVGRLRYFTEMNLPEYYPALEFKRVNGRAWVKVRIAGRPNGRLGWVPRTALGRYRIVRTRLEVSRRTLRARLYKDGRKVWESRVGVGKASTPTPRGHYWIRDRWNFGTSNPVYGPYAFGTSAYSRLTDWPMGGIVGIHGTNNPGILPGRVSNGCIRVPNDKIRKLARLIELGTPVIIT